MKKILRKQYSPDAIFDASALTLTTESVKDVGELVFAEKFVSPQVTDFCEVENGIKHDKQIVIAGDFNGLAGSVRTDCDTTPNDGTLGNTEKTWTPKYISDRFEECYANLQASFWKYMLANGIKKEDLTQSAYDAYITERLTKYMNDDMMYRLMFFTNTGITAGTTNNLTSGQLKYFNMINGVFAQADAIVSATAARGVSMSTENGAATKALQVFAAASPTVHPATDYLKQVYFGASIELRSQADAIILCTQSVADQYIQEREAVSSIPLAYDRTEQGMKMLSYQGIPVIPIPTWDRLIQRHFDNGTVWEKPHRILMTAKHNIRLGTEETANFSELKSEYNAFHEKWFIKFGFNMDVKILDNNLIQYAS